MRPGYVSPLAKPVSDLVNGVSEGVQADLLLELVFERFVEIAPGSWHERRFSHRRIEMVCRVLRGALQAHSDGWRDNGFPRRYS
jgi:hypothetical protein